MKRKANTLELDETNKAKGKRPTEGAVESHWSHIQESHKTSNLEVLMYFKTRVEKREKKKYISKIK